MSPTPDVSRSQAALQRLLAARSPLPPLFPAGTSATGDPEPVIPLPPLPAPRNVSYLDKHAAVCGCAICQPDGISAHWLHGDL